MVGGRNGEIGHRWGFLTREADTERMCSVSPGRWKRKAGCVEGVCRVILICGSMWWEAGIERSGIGGGFCPQEADTEHTCSVSPGHWKRRAGCAEGVRRVMLICGLMWWEAGMERSGAGGVF